MPGENRRGNPNPSRQPESTLSRLRLWEWVPPPLANLALASATARLGHFWKAQVGQFCRAPKAKASTPQPIGQQHNMLPAALQTYHIQKDMAMVSPVHNPHGPLHNLI